MQVSRPARGFQGHGGGSAGIRPECGPSPRADNTVITQTMPGLESDNGFLRVFSEIAVGREVIAGLDELVLEIDDGIAPVAPANRRIRSCRGALRHPDGLRFLQIPLAFVQTILTAVDRPRDGYNIVAIRMAIDVPPPPIGNAGQQRPRKLLQCDRLGFKIRCAWNNAADIVSCLLVVGSSRRLDQSPAAVLPAIPGLSIAQIAPALIGSPGGELARNPEMGTLMGELSHEMAQAERRIDSALSNELLVIHNSLDNPRSGGARHFPNVGRGDGHAFLPEVVPTLTRFRYVGKTVRSIYHTLYGFVANLHLTDF